MAVGEAVASDLSDPRLCNGAVHRADADRRHPMATMHRMTNRPERFVITPSTPDRSGERHPSRAMPPGRLYDSSVALDLTFL